MNLFTEPPSLDPRIATDATSMNVLLALFEGLTRIGDDNLPHPAAAQEILISEDQRVYTFKLRPTKWSNGDPVTAYDFDYAWRSMLDPKFPSLFAYKLFVIENAAAIKEKSAPLDALGVRVLDERTLEVTLRHPTPYFLELVAFPTFYPIHKKNAEQNPLWASEAGPKYIGNGPFKLDAWVHDSELKLSKNPEYWEASKVRLDKLHLTTIDDTTTEFYMYEQGELDIAGSPLSNLPPEFLPALLQEGVVNSYTSVGSYYFKINTENPPFHNPKIRKALGIAINRKAIVEHITQAGQIPALGIVPPMQNWSPVQVIPDGHVSLARKLFYEGLEEEGLTLETFPVFTLSYNTNREHQKIAQAIQQQWHEVLGIRAELESCDWKVYLAKINRKDYTIGRMGWVGDFSDPVSFLEPFMYRDDPDLGGNNETGWEHPDYISYLKQAELELDIEKRSECLRKAETLLIEEMPLIPLYYLTYNYLEKPYVKGIYRSPLGLIDFKGAYLQE